MYSFRIHSKQSLHKPLQKLPQKPPKQIIHPIVAIVSIFKNEEHILEEWIEHYLREGVDLFCLIDNGSTDNYLEKIQKYINSGKVILKVDSSRHQQNELYNKYYLNLCKTFAWVIVVDLDEFMYSRNGYKTMKEYLNSLDDNISQLSIPWKMFGSNGFIQQPESVVQSFVKRQECAFNTHTLVKTISRGNNLVRLDIHCSHVLNYKAKGDIFITEETLRNDKIHLNHYCIQSLEWFTKVKMTRGDCDNMLSENVRNMEYFKTYDNAHSDIIDNELKNKSPVYKK